jgi:hypothetical protein
VLAHAGGQFAPGGRHPDLHAQGPGRRLCGPGHLQSLLGRVSDRRFEIDVLARPERVERQPGVPVVRRGDEDRVNGLVAEDGLVVLRRGGRPAGAPGRGLGAAAVHVTRLQDVEVEPLAQREQRRQVGRAGGAESDQGDAEAIVGPGDAPVGGGGQRGQAARGQGGRLEEPAARGARFCGHDGSPRGAPPRRGSPWGRGARRSETSGRKGERQGGMGR